MTVSEENKQFIDSIKKYLEEKSPEAILWDNCENALIGTARLFREGSWREVSMYDYELLVETFKIEFREEGKSEEDTEQEAIEWVDFNISSVYVGPYTPLILYN
jgi:hypothetical protein